MAAKKISKKATIRKNISLKDKIPIFKRYLETGKPLVGSTKFEGYHIGRWAIQIRAKLKKRRTKNYTKRIHKNA